MTKKEKQQDYLLRKRYGITLTEYRRMLRKQRYKCAICSRHYKEFKRALAVDHNHKTGRIRGLICLYDNSRLMRFLRDDKNRAKGLVKYLQRAIKEDSLWQ